MNLKESYAFRRPQVYLDQLSQRVDELLRQMQNYLNRVFQEKKQLFQNWVGKLHTLSPLGVLDRGYSLTFDAQGNLLKDVKQVQIGELVRTQLKSGTLKSKVTELGAKDGVRTEI